MAFLVGELLTAARLNDEIQSILTDFCQVATVVTLQSTVSTSFVDLATSGPQVTLVSTGTLALVWISCRYYTSNLTDATQVGLMGVAISGATTTAAVSTAALVQAGAVNAGAPGIASGILLPFTITPGSNTYKARYASGSANQSNFSDRKIAVFAP